MAASDKRTGLQQWITIHLKKFYCAGSWGLYYKTFYGRNLRIFVES